MVTPSETLENEVHQFIEEAGIDLSERPRLLAWRERMEALPGWAPPDQLLALN